MNSTTFRRPVLTGLLLLVLAIGLWGEEPTPVSRWGRLQLVGGQLSDASGKPVQLRGVSLADSTNFGELASPANLRWLRDDWGMTVFRAAMYTNLDNKFIGTGAYPREFAIIQAAIDAGLYVLVDWHITVDANPLIRLEEAKDFFAQVATRFGTYPNVIYEICNEPSGSAVTWADQVKPYAQAVIPVIRAIDPAGIILVGTPRWSQQPDVAARDPLPFGNVMYVLHYYAGTHDAGAFLAAIDTARAAGAGVFISEWGLTNSSGKGGIYPAASIAWAREMDKRQLSWALWALSDKVGESSSLLKPQASLSGNWRPAELTEGALLARSLLRRAGEGPIFADGFESGNLQVSGWVRSGAMLDRANAKEGANSLRFEGKAALTKTLTLESASAASLQFWCRSEAFGPKDRFMVEWTANGSDWQTLAAVEGKAASGDWKRLDVGLPAAAAGAKCEMRFRADFAGENARLWLDEVLVQATRAGIAP